MIDIILINPNAVFSQFFNFIEKKNICLLKVKSQVSSNTCPTSPKPFLVHLTWPERTKQSLSLNLKMK